MTPQTC
jgi:hypothetical protein